MNPLSKAAKLGGVNRRGLTLPAGERGRTNAILRRATETNIATLEGAGYRR